MPNRPFAAIGATGALVLMLVAVVGAYFCYANCRIEVPSSSMGILIKKTGKDLENDQEIAPDESYKGVQIKVLPEGRHFFNPWDWDWQVVPQVEIPQDQLGVRIRLYGDDLGYGEIIAWQPNQKGIVPEILRPGRYPINARIAGQPERRNHNYAEHIELHRPVVITAGFRGVVTNLSGPMPKDPNVLLVQPGERGTQEETYDAGTHYINPYTTRINLIDCRSQRFNLSMDGDMGFPSKDGFWVTLDGIVEYRVRPDQASKVLVTYNETSNDRGMDANVSQEIVNKIILPNARSFCRLRGSDHSGQDFIKGDTRSKFQEDFQRELQLTCESQGVQIIQALITRINPPQKIAEPVRQREIALQKKKQFEREILQQTSEQQLAVGQEMVKRKQELVDAERSVIKVTTEAKRRQEVAVIEAEQRLKVAELELQAAQDMAEAARALGEAEAQVIEFDNQAEAAGWKKAISAFGGDGDEYAQWTMLKKLAPSFRQMMVNTADSPLMEIFRRYQSGTRAKPGELLGRQSESEQRPAAATSPAGTTVVPGDLGSAAREN